ncbi:class I SAM-dependent methyltransferase [Thermomonospora catenispora]|uniref:class I SAM-dependent methyltransferase n=1 Tax=Thermomonospora catenispora TaxID=2493090 RepID=UPI00111F3B8E|nr:methyltransferase domain-containing protein [Thermomonospora catenispora]TNY38297.1 methyltransferase domain-containing protein [Thermomonospora catenispora]
MDAAERSWAFDQPASSPFARPEGLLGRLSGAIMRWTNRRDQREVLALLDIEPGQRVLEVGYGPGALIRLLSERTPADHILGVDPSAEMRAAASRSNRAAVAAGRVDLRIGTAADTGLAERSVDVVVSVNSVAVWPDLDAGLRELHRVLKPGGTLLVAWHGGKGASRLARSLRLPEDRLARLNDALADVFTQVVHHRLSTLDAFTAVR